MRLAAKRMTARQRTVRDEEIFFMFVRDTKVM
jgi:hypothetical protein